MLPNHDLTIDDFDADSILRQLLAQEPTLRTSVARESLRDFIHQSWSLVEPEHSLLWNWHLDVICEVLEDVYAGKVKRVIFNLPPGTMKSLIISVFFPAWCWTRNDTLRFMLASYTDVNTIRDNLRCRDVVTSTWYQDNFKVKLSTDQSAKVRFDTANKGWRIATSVGGAATGWHPDFLIIDDPLKAEDVRSDAKIDAVNDWLSSTVSTRVARNPAIILVMQRLHLKDATAYLLARGNWLHVKFPMRYVATKPKTEKDEGYTADPLDIRTQPGELLWPELWPENKLQETELILGPYGVSGQLQQSPVPEGGGLFKRDYFPIVDAVPVKARRCRGWDIGELEKETSNWTVGVKLAITPEGIIYVEHCVQDKRNAAQRDSLMLQTAKMDGVGCAIREGSGSGESTLAAHAKLFAGYDYASMPEREDKVSRAMPFRAQCEAGNVRILKGDWNEAYLSVMCSFPVGKYDDHVDASSNAYNALVSNTKRFIHGSMPLYGENK